jgi:hypothetical protein
MKEEFMSQTIEKKTGTIFSQVFPAGFPSNRHVMRGIFQG